MPMAEHSQEITIEGPISYIGTHFLMCFKCKTQRSVQSNTCIVVLPLLRLFVIIIGPTQLRPPLLVIESKIILIDRNLKNNGGQSS